MKKNLVYILVAVVIIVGGVMLFGGDSAAPSPDDQMEAPTSSESGDAMMEGDNSMEEGDAMMEGDSSMEEGDAMMEGDSSSNAQESATVTYTDEGYSPQTVTISQGGTVTFVNDSSQGMWTASAIHPTHSVYAGTSLSEHCQNGSSDAFDACSEVPSGESWSFTFDETGEWGYHNHTAPMHTGAVVVQ